jgi:hypothetical protein
LDSHPRRQLQKPRRKAHLGRINIPSLSQGIWLKIVNNRSIF